MDSILNKYEPLQAFTGVKSIIKRKYRKALFRFDQEM